MSDNIPNIGKAVLVGRNTAFLIVSRVAGLLLWFVLFGTAKRMLGENFGPYGLVLVTIGPLYQLVLDFGFRHLTVREVARDHTLTMEYLLTGIVLKLALVLPSFGLLVVSFHFIYPPATRIALIIGTVAFVVKSFTLFLTALFDAHERMHLTALVTTTEAVLIFIVCMPLLYLFKGDNIPVLLGEGCASAVSMLLAAVFVFFVFRYSGWRPRISRLWDFFRSAAPFGMYFVFGTIYGHSGVLLLSAMSGKETWGQYVAPLALILKIELLARFFASALYPTMSKEYHYSSDSAGRMYDHAVRLIFMFALPAAVGACVLAPGVIDFAFGGGKEETALLRILAWLIPLRFFGYVLNTTVFVVNRQKAGMVIMGGATVVSIVLNVILIPRFGARGAAVATLVTALLVQSALVWQVRKSLRCSLVPPGILPCIVSCGVMTATLMMARPMPFLLSVPLGAAVFFVSVLALGGIPRSDIRVIKALVSRRVFSESGEAK